MNETPQTPDAGENPTDEDLDVEGPNESTQSHAADPRELGDEPADS
jgi:hypothetical protein